jgi:hypothetical protein
LVGCPYPFIEKVRYPKTKTWRGGTTLARPRYEARKSSHYFEHKLEFFRSHADKLNSKTLAGLKIASHGLQFYFAFLRGEQQFQVECRLPQLPANQSGPRRR